jgi:hypothetical protein
VVFFWFLMSEGLNDRLISNTSPLYSLFHHEIQDGKTKGSQ